MSRHQRKKLFDVQQSAGALRKVIEGTAPATERVCSLCERADVDSTRYGASRLSCGLSSAKIIETNEVKSPLVAQHKSRWAVTKLPVSSELQAARTGDTPGSSRFRSQSILLRVKTSIARAVVPSSYRILPVASNQNLEAYVQGSTSNCFVHNCCPLPSGRSDCLLSMILLTLVKCSSVDDLQ